MRQELIRLLDEILVTHSPGGMEQEMDAVVKRVLQSCAREVSHDAHGNVYITIPGVSGGPLTLVSAHKDELSVIVRKIDDDGKLWVEPIGGSLPAKYGEGPFDVMAPGGVLEGVLCMGSTHCSDLSARGHRCKTAPITWDMVYLDCKLSRQELAARGVMVGDRAVVGRRRKTPLYLHDKYVGGYALDDKAAVAVLLLLAQRLRETPPRHDVCLAVTACEEGGCCGCAYLSRQIDPHDSIAVDVAPVADEYPIKLNEQPVLLFKDAIYHYSPELSRDLIAAGKRCGIECQTACVRSYGSDASVSAHAGLAGRPACICYATENTHGYEITTLAALENCVTVLAEYFTGAKAAAGTEGSEPRIVTG